MMSVAAPDTSLGVAHHVREARDRRATLRIAGAAHWMNAGRPTSALGTLSLSALAGIVDYNPGDLTLTARAGTSLETIAHAAAAEHQWLALDPFGDPSGTLGATVATASSGPLACAFGTPRDNVLGLEIVTGDGRTIRSGGRVVKNVAGFDLTRLFTGSWGTLGVITEVTVRLRALPEVEDTLALSIDEHPETVGALLIRLGGNADSVRAQRAALGFAGGITTVPASMWNVLRTCEPEHAMVMRISMPPSRLAECWV